MTELKFVTDLPLEMCTECIYHDFDIRVNDFYCGNDISMRRCELHCENEPLCSYIVRKSTKNTPVNEDLKGGIQ